MKRLTQGMIVGGLVLALGCAGGQEKKATARVHREAEEAPLGAPGGAPAQGPAGAEPVARKIIYTANVDVIVDEFDDAVEQLRGLIKANKGYIAKSEVAGSPGVPRTGNWTIRVPVDHFEDFLKAVSALGELRRNATDSEDIADKYFDLEARIRTDEAEEVALRKLLEQAANKEILLGLRQELRSIRGQIEQEKGQLQRWSKETQLATVHLTLHDRKDYVSPVTPAFGATVGRTFQGSLDALETFGKGLVLTVVAAGPWLVILAALALVGRAGWRWHRRRDLATDMVPGAGGRPPRA
jgi:hypothetical protein